MKLEKKKKEGKGKGKEQEQEQEEEEEAQGRGKEGGTRKLCSVSSFHQFPSSSATEHSTYKCGTGVLRW